MKDRYAREKFKRLATNLKQPLKVGYFYVVNPIFLDALFSLLFPQKQK